MRRFTRRAQLLLATVLLLLASSPGTAFAGEKNEAAIRIRVIHATQGKEHFDPHLKDLRRYLKIYQFKSYSQKIDQTIHLEPGETKGIGLLRNKNLNAQLISLTEDRATLRLRLFDRAGVKLDTKVNVGRNGLFFIAGPRYEKGILFISVGANYEYDPEAARVANGHKDKAKK